MASSANESDPAEASGSSDCNNRDDSMDVCVQSGKPFPKDVTEKLEALYQRGMTGWGKAHESDINLAIASTGLQLAQIKNWIRRKNMKRKAVEDEVEDAPILKKCRTTTWQRHLQKFATTKEGKEALGISKAFFNKKASASYMELSANDKELLEQEGGPSEYMSKQQVQRRVHRIFKNIQNQFSELEELGYKGFAIAFHSGKSQLVGTTSVLKSFTPHVLEYLHAVIVAANPPPLPSRNHDAPTKSVERVTDRKPPPPASAQPSASKKPAPLKIPSNSQNAPDSIKGTEKAKDRKLDLPLPASTMRKAKQNSSSVQEQFATGMDPSTAKKQTVKQSRTHQPKKGSALKRVQKLISSKANDDDDSLTESDETSEKSTSADPPLVSSSGGENDPNSGDQRSVEEEFKDTQMKPKEKTQHMWSKKVQERKVLITGNNKQSAPTEVKQHQEPPDTDRSHEKGTKLTKQALFKGVQGESENADLNHLWIQSLGLFENDKRVLQGSRSWLNDNIITVAQQLLKSNTNGKDIAGLQSSQYAQLCKVSSVLPRQKWVQIFHVNGDHWIVASNIDMAENAARNDVVYVYDSLVRPIMSLQTKRMICSLAQSRSKTITFDVINVMVQQNSWDCGLFAVANATELLYGYDPARCQWKTDEMRKHLIECFEKGRMLRFPVVKQRRLPLGSRVRYTLKEEIYCVCRMPNDKRFAMIQCSSCSNWYHGECLNINIDEQDLETKWRCDECKEMLANEM